MDSLTQIVLGAGVGELVLGRKIRNRALLWGGIAGTIPDLDVFFTFGDPIREITVHRGFSHSITFALLSSPLLAYITQWVYRNKGLGVSWRQWSWFFFLTIFTHPLLDCLTTYGTQIFYPFSDYRVSVSSVFVVDPMYTLPFMACLIVAAFIRNNSSLRMRWAGAGMLIGSSYLLSGLLLKQWAEHAIGTRIREQGIEAKSSFVGVTPLNIFLWYGVYETDSAYHIAYRSVFDEADLPMRVAHFEKQHQLVDGWRSDHGVDRIIWFGQGMWIARQAENGAIDIFTLKFGMNGFKMTEDAYDAFRFNYRVKPLSDGSLTYEQLTRVDNIDFREALGQLWRRVWGEDVL
jgi:inner membrane protein